MSALKLIFDLLLCRHIKHDPVQNRIVVGIPVQDRTISEIHFAPSLLVNSGYIGGKPDIHSDPHIGIDSE